MADKKLAENPLVDVDGNAFAIIGAFNRQARKEGWTKEEIETVDKEAMSGDYDHLLQVFMSRCE